MKWIDLCLISEQEQNAIQVLKTIVLRNLLGETIYMNDLDIMPLQQDTWLFFKDKYNEYHFVESGWDVRLISTNHPPLCSSVDYHKIVYFLSSVYQGLQGDKWLKLKSVLFQLRNEYPNYCENCVQLDNQNISIVCKKFISSPINNLHQAKNYIDRHCKYMQTLFEQTQQHDLIYLIVKETFTNIQQQYRDCILNNNTDKIVNYFRRDLINKLYENKLSFLSFKNIDFDDWLICLLYMQESQLCFPDTTNFEHMMYKLWILLNLYFTEKPTLKSVNIFLYPNEEIEFDEEEMDKIRCTHPLLRGSLLNS